MRVLLVLLRWVEVHAEGGSLDGGGGGVVMCKERDTGGQRRLGRVHERVRRHGRAGAVRDCLARRRWCAAAFADEQPKPGHVVGQANVQIEANAHEKIDLCGVDVGIAEACDLRPAVVAEGVVVEELGGRHERRDNHPHKVAARQRPVRLRLAEAVKVLEPADDD